MKVSTNAVDPHWIRTQLLTSSRSKSGSREPNQCRSMRFRVRILFRLLLHEKLNFFNKKYDQIPCSWIRIRIPNTDPNPGELGIVLTQANAINAENRHCHERFELNCFFWNINWYRWAETVRSDVLRPYPGGRSVVQLVSHHRNWTSGYPSARSSRQTQLNTDRESNLAGIWQKEIRILNVPILSRTKRSDPER